MKNKLPIITAFLLIAALLLNGLAHFFHPSYRYYRENFEKVERRIDLFEQQVKNDFVPAIAQLASNIQFTAISPAVISQTLESSERQQQRPQRIPINAKASFIRSCGYDVSGFTYSGRLFTLGDSFYGYPLSYIDQTCARTSDGTLYIFTDKKQNQEVVFNDGSSAKSG